MIGRLRLLPGLLVAAVLSALMLWGGYSVWFFAGENYRRAMSPVVVPASSWQMLEGEGGVRGSEFHLEAPGYRGYAFAASALNEPIESEWVDRIVVHFSQIGTYHQLLVGASHSAGLSNLREASLRPSDGMAGRLQVDARFLSRREIKILTLRVRGALKPAMVVERAELHRVRPGIVEFQGMLLDSLVDLGGWTQRSVNQNRPDYVPIRISPVLAVVLWMGLFALLALLLVDRGRLPGNRAVVLSGLGLLIGWILLDAGWQASLWQRHADAISNYAGVPVEARAINGIDAEVVRFIRDLREAIDDANQPLVIFAGSPFAHFRARYAAVPQPAVGRTGVSENWLRRIRPGDVLVALNLAEPLDEQPVSMQSRGSDSKAINIPLESVAGRHAELVECAEPDPACDGHMLRLKEGQRPWLVEVPWMDDLGSGIWQVELDLTGGRQAGWVRLEVLRRSQGNSSRWAWREIYLAKGQPRSLPLAFRTEQGAEYHMRLRELNAQGVAVRSARLMPQPAGGDLVELSVNGDPPYFLARRILKSERGTAWEVL